MNCFADEPKSRWELGALFLENLDDVFRIDPDGLASAEEKDHMKILRGAELTRLAK
jgi:hypothetical protein